MVSLSGIDAIELLITVFGNVQVKLPPLTSTSILSSVSGRGSDNSMSYTCLLNTSGKGNSCSTNLNAATSGTINRYSSIAVQRYELLTYYLHGIWLDTSTSLPVYCVVLINMRLTQTLWTVLAEARYSYKQVVTVCSTTVRQHLIEVVEISVGSF